MKITSSTPASKPASSTATQRSGGSGRAAGTPSGSVSGSSDAARLSQLESQVSPSDFSAAKVSEISAAIAAGRYQVNAGAVADKLLASAAELARKPGSGS